MRGLVRIDFSAFFLGALLVLALPLNWLLAALAAAVMHEFCHCIMIIRMGGRILNVKIGACGAVIETGQLTSGQECLCAMAGPVGSLLLVLLCHVFPRLAICAGVQALFNLLPIYPLDGGRVLRCACEILIPKYTDRILYGTEICSITVVCVAAVIGSAVYHLGIVPIIMVLLLVLKAVSRKIPCKRTRIRVQ